MQRRCRGGAEEVQRRCRGGANNTTIILDPHHSHRSLAPVHLSPPLSTSLHLSPPLSTSLHLSPPLKPLPPLPINPNPQQPYHPCQHFSCHLPQHFLHFYPRQPLLQHPQSFRFCRSRRGKFAPLLLAPFGGKVRIGIFFGLQERLQVVKFRDHFDGFFFPSEDFLFKPS